jgi:hypothetical protein
MADQDQLDFLKRNVDVWNQWRERHSLWGSREPGVEPIQPDLSRADLSGANLSRADLMLCSLNAVTKESTTMTRRFRRSTPHPRLGPVVQL